MLTDIRFWSLVATDAERTVLCSPENESRCKGYIAAAGMTAMITVLPSRLVRDDELIIIDEHAVGAAWAEAIQHDRHTELGLTYSYAAPVWRATTSWWPPIPPIPRITSL